jgi:hypothetical protein
MAAFGWQDVTCGSGCTTMTITCDATATTTYSTDGYGYWTATSNWQSVQNEDAPRLPPEYLKLRRVVLGALPKAQMAPGRSPLARLPRGKLDRWKSLKEKRLAWGLQ